MINFNRSGEIIDWLNCSLKNLKLQFIMTDKTND